MKGLIFGGCLLMLAACSHQAKLKSFYQHEAKFRPTPALTKATLKPRTVESPCYPLEAAIHNAEGWVQLEFSVNEEGRPVAVETIDASPQGLFEQCALNAFSKWTFHQPAVAKLDQRYEFVFRFKLDS